MPRGRAKKTLPSGPGGVREDLNPATIPDGQLLSSSNWLVRQDVGRPRPGYTQLGSTLSAADRITGFGFRGSSATSTAFVVHTLTAGYSWDGASFTDITGTWTSSTSMQPVRFAAFQSGGTLYLLRTNAANAVSRWSGTGSFVAIASAPRGRDITATNGRAVVFNVTDSTTNYPYRVQWTDFNDVDTWGASSYTDLSETPDEITAGRAFGPLSVGVYKEDSLWLGIAQAATAPFQFQFVAHVPGPTSPAALVPYRGVHYWLGKDLVVYSFDGARVQVVNDSIQTTIRNTMSWENRLLSHGCVLGLPEPELWLFYPDTTTLDVKRAVSINLKTGAAHAHTLAHSATASNGWISQSSVSWDSLTGTWDTLSATYASWDAMGAISHPTALLGLSTSKVEQFGIPLTDDGTAIAWNFVHPWRAPGGVENRTYLDGIVSYWKKTSAALTVTVGVTVTDSLGDADTESTSTFDTSTDSNHLVNFTNTKAKWVKVKHSAASQIADMEHRGAAILGWERGMG